MAEYGIVRYAADAPPDLSALVEAAESEHYGFVQRTHREWLAGLNRFDRDGEGFWIATTREGEVVGMCGINIDPYDDDPRVGRLRHLYVDVGHRGGGIGRELVETVLEFGAHRFDLVRLRAPDEDAIQFYDRIGFARSTSPNASHETVISSSVSD